MNINDGLIGSWRLDTGAGLVAVDSSGYGNNGSLQGTNPTWVDGISGRAVNFPGTDERVNCGNAAPLDGLGNGDFSISFWMKSKDTVPNNYGGLFAKTYGGNVILLDSVFTSNQLRFYWKKNLSVSIAFNASPFDMNWNHLVLVVNRATDKAILYCNNSKDAQELDVSNISMDGSNLGALMWGGRIDGTYCYEGLMDECRIYKRVLTEEEIDFLYKYPSGTVPETIELTGNLTKSVELTGNLTKSVELTGNLTKSVEVAGQLRS